MDQYIISSRSTADDLKSIALCIHELLNQLPVTARSKDNYGIRIENGFVIDDKYTGPILEEALEKNTLIKTTPLSGEYKGVPVIVSPIRDSGGMAIGTIGLVDITGIFDLATLMEHQSTIITQVCGKDPCPLPTEAIAAKR